MWAFLNHATVVHDDDLVGVLDGGKAVGNDQRRPALHEDFERRLHLTLGFVIQRRSRLVQDQDGRILDQGARDRQALALSA